jgi:peptidyl-tRNA hydrolase
MKKIFHANGLSAKQAAAIVAGFEKAQIAHVLPSIKAAQEQSAAEDKAFDAFVKSTYGDKMDAIVDSGRKLLEASLPAEVKPKLANLSGEALGILAVALDRVKSQYVNEGGIVGAPTSGASALDISAKLRDNFAKMAPMDPTSPQYEQMKKENAELAQQLAAVRQQK